MQSWWRRANGTLGTHPAVLAAGSGGVTSARVQSGANVDRMTIRPVTFGGQRFIDFSISRQYISGQPGHAELPLRPGRPPSCYIAARGAEAAISATGQIGNRWTGYTFYGMGNCDGDGKLDLVVMLYPAKACAPTARYSRSASAPDCSPVTVSGRDRNQLTSAGRHGEVSTDQQRRRCP